MRTPRNERLSSDIAGEGPERRCILSGEHGARAALIRLAVSPPDPDGVCTVLPDALARAPGRGAWIGVNRPDLETALANGKLKGALARAFGKSLDGVRLAIPADLPDRIEAALLRAFTDRLGLAMRTGQLLLGSDRIAEKAREGRVQWLAHVADASEDGSRRLDQAWRVGQDAEGTGMAGITLPLDRAALSVALGRDNVVHLALTDFAAAEMISAPLQRLLHFMGTDCAGGAEENVTDLSERAAQDSAPVAATIPDSDRVQAN